MYKPSIESNAFCDRHRTQSEPIRSTSRLKTENRIHKCNQRQLELPIQLTNVERFSTTETDTDVCGSEQKREVTDHIVLASK